MGGSAVSPCGIEFVVNDGMMTALVFHLLAARAVIRRLGRHRVSLPCFIAEFHCRGAGFWVLPMENDSSFDHVSDALVDAAYQGDVKKLRQMIQAGADVNLPDFRGDYPVHGAIQTFEIACLKILLQAGAEVNALSSFLSTPFLDACRSGSIKAMTILPEHGADPHARDRGGLTALHRAAESGSFEAVVALLAQGVSIAPRDGSGGTPLLYAARAGGSSVWPMWRVRGGDRHRNFPWAGPPSVVMTERDLARDAGIAGQREATILKGVKRG